MAMRKLKTFSLAVFLAAVGALVVHGSRASADEYNANGTITQGSGGVQTATGTGWQGGTRLVLQCPNIDAGAGQKVYYRPGGCSGCVVDAGPGDVLVDFTTNTDGYPVTLRTGMSKVHLRALGDTKIADGGGTSVPLHCIVAPKSP